MSMLNPYATTGIVYSQIQAAGAAPLSSTDYKDARVKRDGFNKISGGALGGPPPQHEPSASCVLRKPDTLRVYE